MSVDLAGEVESLFREKMLEFLTWSEGHWKITDHDLKTPDDWLADKTADYVKGYNAAIEGMKSAFECWSEEFGP